MDKAPPLFQEDQSFGRWVYVLAVGSLAAAVGGVLAAILAEGGPVLRFQTILPLALLCLALLFIVNMLWLRARIYSTHIHIQLGRWFPTIWTSIPLSDVKETRVVSYRPLLDAGGWGMRFGRFERRSCRYWNAKGADGVLLEARARLFIIGSQNPQALQSAIEKARTTHLG